MHDTPKNAQTPDSLQAPASAHTLSAGRIVLMHHETVHQDFLVGGIGVFGALSLLALIYVLKRRAKSKHGEFNLAVAFVLLSGSDAACRLLPSRFQTADIYCVLMVAGWLAGIVVILLGAKAEAKRNASKQADVAQL